MRTRDKCQIPVTQNEILLLIRSDLLMLTSSLHFTSDMVFAATPNPNHVMQAGSMKFQNCLT